jgi:hypothetical protein
VKSINLYIEMNSLDLNRAVLIMESPKWRGSSDGQSVGFITPRSAVRSRPPLPINSVVYSGQQWPLFAYFGDFCVGLRLSLRKGFNCST